MEASVAEILKIEQIRTDGGTQSRAWIDEGVVGDYAEAMENGATFPDLTVYHDGENYWLSDGYHRLAAARSIYRETISCMVLQGTQADAQWDSFAANATHGLRRSNEDKRRCVLAALKHEKGAGQSDRAIAEHCGVDHKTVGAIRKELEAEGQVEQQVKRVGRDGRQMDVTNLQGRSTGESAAEVCDRPVEPDVDYPEANEDGVYEADPALTWKDSFKGASAEITVLQTSPWHYAYGINCATALNNYLQPLRVQGRMKSLDEAKRAAALELILWLRDRVQLPDTPKAEAAKLKHFDAWARDQFSIDDAQVEEALEEARRKEAARVNDCIQALVDVGFEFGEPFTDRQLELLPAALDAFDWEFQPASMSSWEAVESALKNIRAFTGKVLPLIQRLKKEAKRAEAA
jgi:hypothetical protein